MFKGIQLARAGCDQACHKEAFVKTAVSEVGWVTSQHSEASISQALPYFSNPLKQTEVQIKCLQVNISGRDIWQWPGHWCFPTSESLEVRGGTVVLVFCIMMGKMMLQDLPSLGQEPTWSATSTLTPPHPERKPATFLSQPPLYEALLSLVLSSWVR